jgi:hypothetical protein
MVTAENPRPPRADRSIAVLLEHERLTARSQRLDLVLRTLRARYFASGKPAPGMRTSIEDLDRERRFVEQRRREIDAVTSRRSRRAAAR